MRLVLATRNAHKAAEFGAMLAPHEIVALHEAVRLPPETGATFAENALGKARAAAQATGSVAFADDSGIEAEALDGAPGIFSARFAGPQATDAENLAKLRAEAPVGSGLAYVCAIALVDPASGEEHVFEGRCHGRMGPEARGRNGFGYDPVFLPDDPIPAPAGRTMAELEPEQKAAISHRGRAAAALLAYLETAGR